MEMESSTTPGVGTDLGLEISQMYETEVRDRGSGLGVRFGIIPAESLADPQVLGDPQQAVELLDLEILSDPLSASLLPHAVASVIQKHENPEAAAEYFQLTLDHREAFASDHRELLAFAEYVTYANIVPIEHSLLGADSLGNLLASGSGAGIGAGVGFIVAGGPTPLLFVTVPVGIILCGSAKGIAEGPAEGFRYRIRKLMGVPPEEAPAAAG